MFNSPDYYPHVYPPGPGMTSMPVFLEYVTNVSAGWVRLDASSFSDVMHKASIALQGLECVKADLRQSSSKRPVFGGGTLLAIYTRGEGWRIETARPE